MAQGAPSSVLAGAVTLSGPDTGQSILPIRSRQNSSAYSQVELVKHKKMEGILCKTPWGSVGLSGLPAFITRRALPAALPRAGGNQTPPTWVTQRLVRIGGGCDGSRCPRDSLCHQVRGTHWPSSTRCNPGEPGSGPPWRPNGRMLQQGGTFQIPLPLCPRPY